jgi:hypothetical protein
MNGTRQRDATASRPTRIPLLVTSGLSILHNASESTKSSVTITFRHEEFDVLDFQFSLEGFNIADKRAPL